MNRIAKKKALSITETAAQRIKELLLQKQAQQDLMVKVGVKRRGCNGYSYVMNYSTQDEVGKLDEVVEENGVKVIIDQKALMFLLGTEMDFIDTDIRSEFVFNNPNAKGHCGCGESFHI